MLASTTSTVLSTSPLSQYRKSQYKKDNTGDKAKLVGVLGRIGKGGDRTNPTNRGSRSKSQFMPHMYILECVDGSYYTGSTKNLKRRLWQHQQGLGANHTAKRLPVKLVYCEFFDRVSDAFYREKQIQGWSRKKKQALIAGATNLLHDLAECQNETHYSNLGWLRLRSASPSQSVEESSLRLRSGSSSGMNELEDMPG